MRQLPLLLAALLAAWPALAAQSGRAKTRPNAPQSTRSAPAPIAPLALGLTPTLSPSLAPAAPGLTAPSVAPALSVAAPAPVNPPGPPAAAAAAPPSDGPPYFVQALIKNGVPAELAGRLQAYLPSRHPGDQDKVYHGLGHSQDVPSLMARVLDGRDMPKRAKVLLLTAAALHDVDPERAPGTPARVSATVDYLAKDGESRALIEELGRRFGFTGAQVAALIKATDFNPDPAKLQAIQEEFRRSADAAFEGDEKAWALAWGPRLAFVDKAASYIGSIETAERQVKNLAYEIRQGIEAATGKPSANPTDEAIRKGTYDFISKLLSGPDADLLPMQELANLTAVVMHFQEVKEKDLPPAERAPLDFDAARRYIRSVMGSRKPTARETDALLLDFMEMKGIDRGSDQARSLRAGLLPDVVAAEQSRMAGVSPVLSRYEDVLLRVSDARGVPVTELEALLKSNGLFGSSLPPAQVERALNQLIERREMDAFISKYPAETEQGRLMREVGNTMLARSGKSVEETARDGVFIYADFAGSQVSRASVGRDPDPTAPHVLFYIVRNGDKWRLSGYRQNRSTGRSDAALIESLVRWLHRGGVPASDFAN